MPDHRLSPRDKGFIRGRVGEDPDEMDRENDAQYRSMHPVEQRLSK